MKYFDWAATTPPYSEVIDTVAEIMGKHYGNPSSLHQLGEAGSALLNKSREVCAGVLQVKPKEIIFTSGATESNNYAIKGAAFQYKGRGQHVITLASEHPSVYETCKQLEMQGWEVTYLPVNSEGQVTVQQVRDAIRADTVLVTIMHVNNETGAIQPVEQIGRMLKQSYPRIIYHVDGVQGFSTLPLCLRTGGIDLYSLSAHKFRGPKGVGLLYVREGVMLVPLMAGGGQEEGRRSGTENVPLIVGMTKALRMTSEGRGERAVQLTKLKNRLIQEIATIPCLVLNTSSNEANSAPHIVHFSCPGMKAEAMLHMFEEYGYIVSTKSACSSKRSEPSRVLLAMGRGIDVASSGIRISLYEDHTEQDMDQLLMAIRNIVKRVELLIGED